MNEAVKYQELILEAIDQLRRRKARPDAERIFNCLYRRKGIGSAESKIALERCVENGIVLRVTYKGNTSYRNAAKKYIRQPRRPVLTASHRDSKHASDQKPRRKFTNLLTGAFAELVLEEPDYIDKGIPADRLTNTILLKDSVRYSKRYLAILLQKEVESGGLVQLDNGNYLVGKPPSIAAQNQVVLSFQHKIKQQRMMEKFQTYAKEVADEDTGSGGGAGGKDDDDNDEDDDDDDDDIGEEEEEEVDDDDDDDNNHHHNNKAHLDDVRDNPVAAESSNEAVAANALVALNAAAVNTTNTAKARTGKVGRPQKRTLMEKHPAEDGRTENQRVGGRRKKAKKVFDPSDCNMPKRRGRPLGSTKLFRLMKQAQNTTQNNGPTENRPESRTSQNGVKTNAEGGVCCVCHLQNKRAASEIISCRECSNKAHTSCLNGNNMMLKMYPDNTWRCPHCKTCIVCDETSNAGNMVVCAVCADAYHVKCHKPPLVDKVKQNLKWTCCNCQAPEQLAVDNIQIGCNGESQKNHHNNNDETTTHSIDLSANSTSPHLSSPASPTLPTLSPQTAHNGPHNNNNTSSESDTKSEVHSIKDEELDENIDPSIPDASNWTPEEVCQYFAQFFPGEAHVFKEQEIDGHSLLLMTRMDVLKGLCLKLGPALKIYRHVLKLQYRRDDPKLYWA